MADTVTFYNAELAAQQFTFTKNATWQTVDIGSKLTNPELAQLVFINAQENNVAAPNWGCRWVGAIYASIGQSNLTTANWVVPVTPSGSTVNIQCYNNAASSTTWSVLGQINAGFVQPVGGYGWELPSTNNAWHTVDMSAEGWVQPGDSGEIALAVIRHVKTGNNTNNLLTGFRPIGSGQIGRNTIRVWQEWAVVGVDDNDQFQWYKGTASKSATNAFLVGYIKRGYGFTGLDWELENFTGGSIGSPFNWRNVDMNSYGVPEGATRIMGTMYHSVVDTSGTAWRQLGHRDDTNSTGQSITSIKGQRIAVGMNLPADGGAQIFHQEGASFSNSSIFGASAYWHPDHQYRPSNTLLTKGGVVRNYGKAIRLGN